MTTREELRSRFVAAFGTDVDLVRDELREKDGATYWLASVRPKRSGEIVFRHTYQTPGSGYRYQDHEMRIFVGERGAPRALRADLRPQRVSVGDLVLVPVRSGKGIVGHAFRTDSRFPRYYRSDFPSTYDERPLASGVTELHSRDGDAVLRYLGREAVSSVHRSGAQATLGLTAYFEATGVGRLNIELSPRLPDALGVPPGKAHAATCSIVVVPDDAAIATVVAEESIHEKDEDSETPRVSSSGGTSYPVGVLMLRRGDRFALSYGTFVVSTRQEVADAARDAEPAIRTLPFEVDRSHGFTDWLPVPGPPSDGPPYLRWSFTEVPMPDGPESWYHQDSVSLVGPDDAALWEVCLPERMRRHQAGIGRAEIDAYRMYPRSTHGLTFLIGQADLGDAIAIAVASGLLVLSKRDGSTLLDFEPPRAAGSGGDRLWFDSGNFVVLGEDGCHGPAKGARFLAVCGSRLVLFDGHAVSVFSKEPLRLLDFVPYEAARHARRRPGFVSAEIPVLDLRVLIDGVVHLR